MPLSRYANEDAVSGALLLVGYGASIHGNLSERKTLTVSRMGGEETYLWHLACNRRV